MRPYPKLMCLREAPDEFVVLFRLPSHGMVVHSEGSDRPVFGHIGLFEPEDFADVDEDVIIWLTEGPPEPIYEAIEMVDKIRMLKEPLISAICSKCGKTLDGSVPKDAKDVVCFACDNA